MPASPVLSLVSNVHHSRIEPRTKDIQMSHTNLLVKSFDPFRYRVDFPEQWAAFLHEVYPRPETVAEVFGVRFQTALNWWNGAHRPSGNAVAQAAVQETDAFVKHMQVAA